MNSASIRQDRTFRTSNATLILFTSAFALYLGVVYVFSFSMDAASARYAINSAIVIMDALMAAASARRYALTRSGPRSSTRRTGPAGASDMAGDWVRLPLSCHRSARRLCIRAVQRRGRRTNGVPPGSQGLYLSGATPLRDEHCVVNAASAVPVHCAGVAPTRPKRFASVLDRPDSSRSLPAYNSELFTLSTAVRYLAFFLLCPLVGFLLVQLLQRALDAPAISAPLLAGLSLVYYSMPLVSAAFKRPVEALFFVNVALAVIVPLMLAAIYHTNRKSVARAVTLFAVFSMAVSLVQATFIGTNAHEIARAASLDSSDIDQQLAKLLSAPAKRRPDVYLLVYDALAPSSMMARYGIDDQADTDYLVRRGFKIYEDSYSLFFLSKPSMSSMLNMKLNMDGKIGGQATAIRFFRHQGYRTHLILNSYLLQGAEPTGVDVMFPSWQQRWDLGALYRGLGGGQFKPELVFHDTDRNQWLAAKRTALMNPAGPPRMLYAHSIFPGHSELSGRCLPDETSRYAARLAVARDEMRRDIEAALHSRRDAVIIVAGDHGPYLTGDCTYMTGYTRASLTATHLADRYGARLAIRWPGKVPEGLDQIKVLQDVFFGVSAYLLDDERVWRHRLSADTFGMRNIPDGAISSGVVTVGRDEGTPLFR